jgi:hypothetical protein
MVDDNKWMKEYHKSNNQREDFVLEEIISFLEKCL